MTYLSWTLTFPSFINSFFLKPARHLWQDYGTLTLCPQEGCWVNQIQPLCPEKFLGFNFVRIFDSPIKHTWSMTMMRPLSITVLRRCAIVITVQFMKASLTEKCGSKKNDKGSTTITVIGGIQSYKEVFKTKIMDFCAKVRHP